MYTSQNRSLALCFRHMIMMASGFLCLFISLGCLVGPSVSFITATGTTVSITVSKHVNSICRAPLGDTNLSLSSTLQILTFEKIKLHKDLNKEYQWLLDGISPIATAHQGQAAHLNEDFAKLALGATVEGSYEDGIKVDIPDFKHEWIGKYLLCQLININSITQEYEVYKSEIIPLQRQCSELLPVSFSEGFHFQCSVQEDIVQVLPGLGNRSMVVCPPGSSPTTDNQGHGDCATWHCERNLTMTESDQLHKRCYLKFRLGKKDISYECTGKTLNTFDCTTTSVNVVHDVEEQSSSSSCTKDIIYVIIISIVSCIFLALLFYFKVKLCILCAAVWRICCDSLAGIIAKMKTGNGHVKSQYSHGNAHDEDDDDKASSDGDGVFRRESGRVKRKPATVQDDQDGSSALVTSAS